MQNNGSFRIEGPTAAPAGCGTSSCSHRILVVEGDSDLRQLNAEALAGSGYHVDAAEDGTAGWEALNANSYDLLITDHNMPKLSGINLIKKLRSARMAVPVILSSEVIPGERLELPLVAALPKPFTLDHLLRTVRQVLRATESDRESWEPLQIRPSSPSADGYTGRDNFNSRHAIPVNHQSPRHHRPTNFRFETRKAPIKTIFSCRTKTWPGSMPHLRRNVGR